MRIIRYLRQCWGAAILIVALLALQAFCDLSLPRYTSSIVDVGIQQSGIEHAATDEMSQATFEAVALMASRDDEATLRDAYAWDAGSSTYKLTPQGEQERDALDAIVAFPLAVTHYADLASVTGAGQDGTGNARSAGADAATLVSPNDSTAAPAPDGVSPAGDETGNALDPASFDVNRLLAASAAGLVSKDDVRAQLDAVRASLGAASDSIVAQMGIAAAKVEYQQLGRDLGAMQMRYLLVCAAKMLGLTLLGAAIAIGVGLLASRSAAKIARSLRQRLFERVVHFSDAEVQGFSAASLITRGTNDIQQIQMTLVMLLRMVLYAPILAIGGIIMVASTDVSMSWVIALAVVVLFIVIGILMAVAMPKFKAMQRLIDRVNLVAREMLTGLPVIRAFDRQQFEAQRFEIANRELMGTQLFTNRTMTFMMPAMMLIMNGVSVLIVWAGGHAIDAGTMQTGDMIAFLTYAMVIIMGFLMIGMVSIMLPRTDVAAGRVDEVLACTSSIADPVAPRDAELGRGAGARVAFEDVTFRYPEAGSEIATDGDGARACETRGHAAGTQAREAGEAGEAALSHVDFVAEPGATLAIIGSTGSGKSTAAKLIERFYDVSEGRVTIDGIDVRELSQHALRAQIGYVPQQAFLFSGTIGSAIAYADPAMDEGRIERAARAAQASDFIAEREQGLDTQIAQGGTNVSGGQRQRLAIARAIASDARVLLFDDSFSALDYKTDAALRRALRTELTGRTLIIVAQRISTVLDADQIVVLDEGRMVGRGTHAELMRDCEEYREIAHSQLSEEELAAQGGVATAQLACPGKTGEPDPNGAPAKGGEAR